jgi:thiol-disulfide isomerase/thioredoxin
VLKKKISSTGLRALFGWPSGLLRTIVGSSSGALRLLVGYSSGRSRSTLEADSKPSRSVAEPVSNESRRSLEALPKTTRRKAKENLRKGRICSGDARYLTGLFLAVKSTIDSRLSYRECTDSVPKRYWKGTKELLKRYQIATKQVQAFGSFLVNFRYKLGRAMEMPAKMHSGDLVNGAYGCCLKSEGLQAFCGTRVCKNEYLAVQQKSTVQKALKCVIYLSSYKRCFRISLPCLFLVIVFQSSNFSFKALKSIRVLMVLALMVSMFSLLAQTPRKDSGADGLSPVGAMSIGDRVDDEFYSHMHKSVDWQTKAIKEINLKAHKDKLIILDFWASWCSPCLSSLKKIDSLKKTWDADKVIVIPVAYEQLKDIDRILAYFKWDYTTIFQDTYLKTRFPHQGLPFMVWIKDGRIIATPKTGYATTANVNAVLTGKNLEVFNKTDVKLIDTARVFFTKENGQPDRSFYDTKDAKLVGYIQGYSETNFNVFKTKDSLTLYVINSTIDRIYKEAYMDIIYPYQSKKQTLQWEIGADFLPYLEKSKPRENWTGDLSKDKQLQQWKSMHCFSMMVTVPRDSGITGARSKMRKLLASSIEQKFGLSPQVKFGITQRYPVLALTETKQSAEIKLSQLLRTPPKKGFENYAVPFGDQPHFKLFIENALQNINSLRLTEYRIWDRTGIASDFPAKFSFPVNLAQEQKFANVQNLLKQYGLQILVEEKPIPYLCIGQLADHSKYNDHENL